MEFKMRLSRIGPDPKNGGRDGVLPLWSPFQKPRKGAPTPPGSLVRNAAHSGRPALRLQERPECRHLARTTRKNLSAKPPEKGLGGSHGGGENHVFFGPGWVAILSSQSNEFVARARRWQTERLEPRPRPTTRSSPATRFQPELAPRGNQAPTGAVSNAAMVPMARLLSELVPVFVWVQRETGTKTEAPFWGIGPTFNKEPHGCGSKIGTQNGILVNGNMD